jgi:hypothetical protein
MDWEAHSTNYIMTQAEVETLISSVLNGASGWEQAGITARQVVGAPVVFQVVEEADGESPEYARTFWNQTPVLVQLEYARIQAGFGTNIANHEAGHAFFWGTHGGTGSIMTGDSPDGWPTASDIASVEAWLGSPEDEGTGGIFWFPGDIGHHFTPWPLGNASEVCLNATVFEGVAGAMMQAVWGRSYDAMIEGRFHDLTLGVDASTSGFFTSGFSAVPDEAAAEAAVLVGIVVKNATAATLLTDLVVGLAEVQIR